MKVLIVTDYFYPHWTGLSKSFYNLIKAKIKGIKFDVLTIKHDKKLSSTEKIFDVTIFRVPYLISFSRVKYSVLILFKFISLINNYEGVLINSPCSNILPIALLSKIFNKKIFIFHQGDLVLRKGLKNRILEITFDISTKASFYLADKISTYSNDYAVHSRVIKPFLNKFTPLLLPVLINKKNVGEKNLIYKKLSDLKKHKKIIIGFAGRFVAEKGFDVLMDAIPKIIKENPNIYFVFAGDINIAYENFYYENIHKFSKIKSSLTILGLLNEIDMQNFYHLIDYIVIPSRSDCFNLVQAEAMLFGKPSIVSNVPGARYLVKKTGFGSIFEPESAVDLKSKIITSVKERVIIMKKYRNVIDILQPEKISNRISEFFNIQE